MVSQYSQGGLQCRSSWRFFTRHPWQLWLTLLSIALGTAVMVAVDLANSTASESFDQSVSALSGSMTHEIYASQGDLPEDIYSRLRLQWLYRDSLPLVEGEIVIEGQAYSLMGTDPFAVSSSFLSGSPDSATALGLSSEWIPELLTVKNSVVLPAGLAKSLSLQVGDDVVAYVGDQSVRLKLIAVTNNAADPRRDIRLDNVVLTDIATAQNLLNKPGVLSRIQLLASTDEAEKLRSLLPKTLVLSSFQQQQQTFAQMTRAFRVNLMAMSLLAMLVGAFLVYNTMTFSVLQRRRSFAINRMVGMTGSRLFYYLLTEALLLGLMGGILGIVLGLILGQGLLILVSRTISDLYVNVSATDLQAGLGQLARSLGITLVAVFLATLGPALEAARVSPVLVSRASSLEHKGEQQHSRLMLIGLVCMLATPLLMMIFAHSLVLGFAGLFLFVMGYSLIIPWALARLLPAVQRLAVFRGLLAHLSLRGVQSSLSRTSLAIIALTVAVSATVGVSIMIGSFRASVADWLESTLRSDIYISATSRDTSRSMGSLDDFWLPRLQNLENAEAISTGRNLRVDANGSQIPMLVLQPGGHSARGFQFLSGDQNAIWQEFLTQEVILISEPFAYHQQLQVGDRVSLLTGTQGQVAFRVAGIYQDYSASQGMAVMPRRIYDRFWSDRGVSTIGVTLHDPDRISMVMQALRGWAAETSSPVLIRSNRDIREYSLRVFDRTFAVTHVLRILVVMVAFIGVFSALMALFLEKSREYAILRATGMTPVQLRLLVFSQSAFIGLVAGILSLPLGWVMSDILIEVINRRSFGWSMQSYFFASIPFQALFLSIFAALLAAIYPTRRISAVSIREGLNS